MTLNLSIPLFFWGLPLSGTPRIAEQAFAAPGKISVIQRRANGDTAAKSVWGPRWSRCKPKRDTGRRRGHTNGTVGPPVQEPGFLP